MAFLRSRTLIGILVLLAAPLQANAQSDTALVRQIRESDRVHRIMQEIPGRSGSEDEPPEEAGRPGSARYPQTEEEPAEAGSEQLRMDMDPDPEDQAP